MLGSHLEEHVAPYAEGVVWAGCGERLPPLFESGRFFVGRVAEGVAPVGPFET